jgi:FkbM family methyltransferase
VTLKHALRRRMSDQSWARLARGKRTARDGAAGGLAQVVGGALDVLPVAARLRLRDRLATTAPLDFPGRELKITVATTTEWDMRRFPVRKEPETVAWLSGSLQPGDVLFDVGANVGAYSLIACAVQPQARVYAFEPVPATFAHLYTNVIDNGLEQVAHALPVALSDEDALLPFGGSAAGAGGASLAGLEVTGGGATVLAMRMDTLRDLLALPCPTHLKIDVDGSEHRVLRGARRTLQDTRLRTILVEVERAAAQTAEVRQLLDEAGFVLREDVHHAGSDTHNLIYDRA